jgi:hypothetical protein
MDLRNARIAAASGLSAPEQKAVEMRGNDERGTLFGVGRFLRELRWDRGRAEILDGLDFVSSPKYPLRGHPADAPELAVSAGAVPRLLRQLHPPVADP